jgi:3-mercaptopropionate dioxygenase
MCQGLVSPTETGQDEWYLDNEAIRTFIGGVQDVRARESDPNRVIEEIEPAFKRLLSEPDWLPTEFAEPSAESGMGSGIGMWLLYKSAAADLVLSSLVVPPGASTPVHDHLAWGVVGLYRGNQDEVVFTRTDDASDEGKATLVPQTRRSLVPGDLYELLPETDIHQVTTTSDMTSVSLHLLGNNNGCIMRHRFLPAEGKVEPFKSGWLNVECEESATTAAGVC